MYYNEFIIIHVLFICKFLFLGPPLRGAPSGIRGPPPRGPSPRHIMMSRGPPPRGGPPRGPPFASMPGRGGPPRGPPGPWAANGLGPRPNSLVINQSRRASYAGPSTVAAMATSVRSHESTKTVPGNIVQSHPPSTFPSYKPNISNKSIAPLGVLTIRCVKAIDLASSNDSSIFTKADPYVKLTIGETVFLTKTKVRAGADPVSSTFISLIKAMVRLCLNVCPFMKGMERRI